MGRSIQLCFSPVTISDTSDSWKLCWRVLHNMRGQLLTNLCIYCVYPGGWMFTTLALLVFELRTALLFAMELMLAMLLLLFPWFTLLLPPVMALFSPSPRLASCKNGWKSNILFQNASWKKDRWIWSLPLVETPGPGGVMLTMFLPFVCTFPPENPPPGLFSTPRKTLVGAWWPWGARRKCGWGPRRWPTCAFNVMAWQRLYSPCLWTCPWKWWYAKAVGNSQR